MKAILFYQHGGSNVLQYSDFPDPEPALGQVLVRLKVAALNRLDLWVRRGWPGLKLEYPHIPGADGAGEIASLGSGVKGWEIGDRVVINSNLSCSTCDYCLAGRDNYCQSWKLLGETVRGTYAEYVQVPAVNIHRIPDAFDERLAAAGALVYHTAWHSLITRAQVRGGERILVVGASGGVNLASIQIAKLAGATVYVVGSTAEKLSLADSIGADYLIDRSKDQDWAKTVYLMTNKDGVDLIVDNVGTTFPMSFRAAKKGGRILTVGSSGGAKFEIDNRYIFGKQLSLIGTTMGTHKDFRDVFRLIFERRLEPVVDKVFPLSEAHHAQDRLERGEQMGKIILSIE